MKKKALIHKQFLLLIVFTILLINAKAQTRDSVIHRNKIGHTHLPSKTHAPFKKDTAGKKPFDLPAPIKPKNNDEKIKDSILKNYKF